MSWQKNNTHLPSPHKSFEYLSRCFFVSSLPKQITSIFCYSNIQPSHFEQQQLYLVLVERFPTHWRLSVQSLLPQNLISAEKNPDPMVFGMVKPEVKTWMCHLQDLVGNRFTMVWTCLWTANALYQWKFHEGPAFFFNLELLLIGVVQSWILEKRIMGPGIPSGFGTPFLSHRFLVVQNCLNIHPPKNLSKLVSFHHGYRFDFMGLPNASCHFSNPNSLDRFLTPRQLAWSFQHHLAHLSNCF